MENFSVAMELLAILTSVYYNTYQPIVILQSLLPIHKSFQYQIESDRDQRLRRLEDMVVKLEKEVSAGVVICINY